MGAELGTLLGGATQSPMIDTSSRAKYPPISLLERCSGYEIHWIHVEDGTRTLALTHASTLQGFSLDRNRRYLPKAIIITLP